MQFRIECQTKSLHEHQAYESERGEYEHLESVGWKIVEQPVEIRREHLWDLGRETLGHEMLGKTMEEWSKSRIRTWVWVWVWAWVLKHSHQSKTCFKHLAP